MLDTQWNVETKACITKSGKEMEKLEVTWWYQGEDKVILLEQEASGSFSLGLISLYTVAVSLLGICPRERITGTQQKQPDKSVWNDFYLQQTLTKNNSNPHQHENVYLDNRNYVVFFF